MEELRRQFADIGDIIREQVAYTKELTSDGPRQVKSYFHSLLPIFQWLPRYNWQWALGDAVAGLTVGIMVVPQALSYAKIANLPIEYGLYTAFVGVIIYCLFATSKDMTIGPTAVLSLLMGQIMGSLGLNKSPDIDRIMVATTLSFLAGIICIGLGVFRLGIIVDFIPLPVITGFVTGSAVTIIISQVPGLLGIPNVNNRDVSQNVVVSTFQNLNRANWPDAVVGIVSIIMILGIQHVCRKYQARSRVAWFTNLSRNAIAVIVFTIISLGVSKTHPNSLSIIKNLPSGLIQPAAPNLSLNYVSYLGGNVFIVTLVAIIEHMSIAKSFGRKNGYTVNPSQELIAIGMTNFLGSFLHAYPSTGSFSRSAIKSESGVRTPLAGVLTGILVLLALYFLTPAFYYIPNATLSAVIILSVVNLIVPFGSFVQMLKISPLDFLISMVAMWLTILVSVETGIEASMALAAAVLLIRIARPGLKVLGKESADGPLIAYDAMRESGSLDGTLIGKEAHVAPYPAGALVFQFKESILYPNVEYLKSRILRTMYENNKRGGPVLAAGLKTWNDITEVVALQQAARLQVLERVYQTRIKNIEAHGSIPATVIEISSDSSTNQEKPFDDMNAYELSPLSGDEDKKQPEQRENHRHSSSQFSSKKEDARQSVSLLPDFRELPELRAVVFDLANTNFIDSTGVQLFLDLQNDMLRYSGFMVEFHFVNTRQSVARAIHQSGLILRQVEWKLNNPAALTNKSNTVSKAAASSAKILKSSPSSSSLEDSESSAKASAAAAEKAELDLTAQHSPENVPPYSEREHVQEDKKLGSSPTAAALVVASSANAEHDSKSIATNHLDDSDVSEAATTIPDSPPSTVHCFPYIGTIGIRSGDLHHDESDVTVLQEESGASAAGPSQATIVFEEERLRFKNSLRAKEHPNVVEIHPAVAVAVSGSVSGAASGASALLHPIHRRDTEAGESLLPAQSIAIAVENDGVRKEEDDSDAALDSNTDSDNGEAVVRIEEREFFHHSIEHAIEALRRAGVLLF